MEIPGGIWLEALLLPIVIIHRVPLTLTNLSYLLWCCTSKKEGVGFEIRGYSIKVINHSKIFYDLGRKFKEAELVFYFF